MKTPLRTIALAALLTIGSTASAQMKIGLNLGGGVSYFEPQAFSDLLRQGNAPTGKVTPRPDGWPEFVDDSVGQVQAISATTSPMAAGEYILSAEGKGEIRVSFGGGVWHKGVFDGPRKDVKFTLVTPKPVVANVNTVFWRSEKSDPLRNIHLMAPDAVYRHPFRKDYLDDLRGVSIVRTMDWQLTNTKLNEVVTWADYQALWARFTHQGVGVPLADCAALANEVGADLWVCLPLNADDDCLKQMALLLDAKLKPGLKLYVEYSNEVWNQSFKQGAQLAKDATAAKKNFWRYGGEVSARRMVVFRDALVKAKSKRTVVRVLAGQALYFDGGRSAVEAGAEAGGFDAIACAPYFGIPKADESVTDVAARFNAATDPKVKADCIAETFDRLHQDITKIGPFLRQWRDLAAAHGVPLLAYEGGQHLIAFPKGASDNPASRTPLFDAVNRSPRMATAYARYLEELEAAGFAACVLFNSHSLFSQYGEWGLREYPGQPLSDAPKARAVLDFIAR